jgi:hypothetical protein
VLVAEGTSTRATVAGLRRQDWAFFVALFCLGGAFTSFGIGDRIAPIVYAIGTVLAGALARHWSRRYPAPMPHALRWFLYLSHPGLTPRALHRVLAPYSGGRMLENRPRDRSPRAAHRRGARAERSPRCR